jgi:hypothetical protein
MSLLVLFSAPEKENKQAGFNPANNLNINFLNDENKIFNN